MLGIAVFPAREYRHLVDAEGAGLAVSAYACTLPQMPHISVRGRNGCNLARIRHGDLKVDIIQPCGLVIHKLRDPIRVEECTIPADYCKPEYLGNRPSVLADDDSSGLRRRIDTYDLHFNLRIWCDKVLARCESDFPGLVINTCATLCIYFPNKVLLAVPGLRSTTKPTALKTTLMPDRYAAWDTAGLKSSIKCGWIEHRITQSYTRLIESNTVPESSDSKKLNWH